MAHGEFLSICIFIECLFRLKGNRSGSRVANLRSPQTHQVQGAAGREGYFSLSPFLKNVHIFLNFLAMPHSM